MKFTPLNFYPYLSFNFFNNIIYYVVVYCSLHETFRIGISNKKSIKVNKTFYFKETVCFTLYISQNLHSQMNLKTRTWQFNSFSSEYRIHQYYLHVSRDVCVVEYLPTFHKQFIVHKSHNACKTCRVIYIDHRVLYPM